ncbi:hypothetical protein GCM10011507_04320 [Edaphobacter acidisoli]|uniref:Uncharacterized protein n=1 Tax=Edaphobacter acidisoli TaxID=2040573 RepID=A0A916RHC5_9BACT|nr:hypothetical protein [Edaphobacter acidisoli]GGA56160.1 hypothetical protein GCM10011507_04320 [Edaphobacter acidisoli]
MQMEQNVTEILDEAIRALAVLDLNRLKELEVRVDSMATAGTLRQFSDRRKVAEKQRLLRMLLENCKSNLDTLHRLHVKNTREQWAH